MPDIHTYRVPLSPKAGRGYGTASILQLDASEDHFRDSNVISSPYYWISQHSISEPSTHIPKRILRGKAPVSEHHLLVEIENLTQRVAKLEASIVVVEELTWEDAIEKARAFFADRTEPAYPDELAETLETSISQAIALCEALEQEGLVVTK